MNSWLTILWGRLPIPGRVRSVIIWLLSAKFTVGVSALVLDEQERVLLLRHTYRPSRPWGLPGGGLHPAESLEECLCRELFEETGLRIEVNELLSAASHHDRKLVDMIFMCRLAPGETLASFKASAEVVEARFFTLYELPDNMSPGQRKLIYITSSMRAKRGA